MCYSACLPTIVVNKMKIKRTTTGLYLPPKVWDEDKSSRIQSGIKIKRDKEDSFLCSVVESVSSRQVLKYFKRL